MEILGIDFTSSPKRGKPLVCLTCSLQGKNLLIKNIQKWESFRELEQRLQKPGPWIAGLDFPFGQSRKFIQNIGWPQNSWAEYVARVAAMNRRQFCDALEQYEKTRNKGDLHHRRKTDVRSASGSPQNRVNPPVAKMFFEGAPRLLRSGATVLHLRRDGDPKRIVLEAYPRLAMRALIGKQKYKGGPAREKREARHAAVRAIFGGRVEEAYGLKPVRNRALAAQFVEDNKGDSLDSLLCAVQAAWAWKQRARNFGAPPDVDPLEGWIADPSLNRPASPKKV